MDRPARRLRGSLLIASALTFGGCRSKPIAEVFDPVAAAQNAKCEELGLKRENCGFGREILMTIQLAAQPDNTSKRDKRNPNLIAGECEVWLLNTEDPAAAPEVRPCPAVVMSVSNPALIGEKPRSNRLDVRGGIVGGLPRGLYSVNVSSELYKTRAFMTDVPSGSLLKIIFRMPVKLVLPPDPNAKTRQP
jgi:hypothetical protein